MAVLFLCPFEIETMTVKHGILGILARGSRHGYEIKSEFDQLTGGLWDLNVGQVYSTLDRLRKEELVALELTEGAGEDRKVYSVAPEGLGELERWLDRAPLKPKPVRDENFVRLALLRERDREAAFALLDSQRRVCHLQMADLTRQKVALGRRMAPDRVWQELLLDAALLHTEADLRWLDLCEAKLRAGGGWR